MNEILMSCHDQIMGLFRDLDESRYESLAARFAPEGLWHRQGKTLRGRRDIVQALGLRSRTQRIHHIITNLAADRIGPRNCALRGYMLVVRYDDGKPLAGPAPLSGIENIRTTHIELSKIDGRWLIVEMGNDEPTFASA